MTTSTLTTPLPARSAAIRFGPLAFLQQLFRTTPAQNGGALVRPSPPQAAFAPLVAPYDPSAQRVGSAKIRRRRRIRWHRRSRPRHAEPVITARELRFSWHDQRRSCARHWCDDWTRAGFYGGWIDSLLMRFTDIMLAFPGFLLTLAIVAVLGPGLTNAMIAVGVGAFPGFARLVRGSVLSIRETEYVTAERVLGATPTRIMRRSILPNVLAPIIVLATLAFPLPCLCRGSLLSRSRRATPDSRVGCPAGRRPTTFAPRRIWSTSPDWRFS